MKKIIQLLLLLLPIIATAQTSPKKVNLASIGGTGSSGGSSSGGLTAAEKTKIDSAINAKADSAELRQIKDSTKQALDALRTGLDGKKDFNPDEVPFTASEQSNLQNALARPVYNAAAVRQKADLIPASEITGTIPIDSVGGLNVSKDSIDNAFRQIKASVDTKKDFDPDEVPFTATEQSNLQNALSRPIYDSSQVLKKNASIPAAQITGTIPIDSVAELNVSKTTIAQLRAMTAPSASFLYYTTDAGQEGFWKWNSSSTTADNTGTVLKAAPATGRYERVHNGTINVSWFGAKSDDAVNDDAAIQAALDYVNSLAGGTVTAPDGLFLTAAILTIGSNTKLVLSPRTIIRRNANINALLINKGDGVTGGYGQANNIEVTGGTWDGNKAAFTTNVCIIAFGHAEYISIHDTKVINAYGWHFIELNSTRHSSINRVLTKDFDATTINKEMIQLDLAISTGAFPWFGPYDNTPCDNISITNIDFINGCRGFGSHSAVAGKFHTNIRLENLHFDGFREEAIFLNDYKNVQMGNITMTGVWKGIYASTLVNQVCAGYKLTNITITSYTSDQNARGVQFNGINVTNRYMQDITLTNVSSYDAGRHGIGFDFCQGVSILACTVKRSSGTGLWLFGTKNAKASGCTLNSNASGVNYTSTTSADLNVGNTSGGQTDTENTLVTGNSIGTFRINYTYTAKVSVETNTIDAAIIVGGGTASTTLHRIANNWIAGTYTP